MRQYFNAYELVVFINQKLNDVLPNLEPIYVDKKGTLLYGEKDGFVDFGFVDYDLDKKHDYSKIWSSNSGYVYQKTGFKTVPIRLMAKDFENVALHMTLDAASVITPPGFTWTEITKGEYILVPKN